MDHEESKFIVKLCHTNPIEINDFTDFMSSFGQQFNRFISKEPENTEIDGVKLYVDKIEAGSIIATIAPNAPYALPFINYSNSVIAFSDYLKKIYFYLLGKGTKPPENTEKQDFELASRMLNAVAKDESAQLNINNQIGDNASFVFNFNSTESNAIQNRARREVERLNEPISKIHEQVVMYLYQARNDCASKTGNFGIVERISKKPVKLRFGNEKIQQEILNNEDGNPFKMAYVVDLDVETVMDKPVLYKIKSYYEKFDIEG